MPYIRTSSGWSGGFGLSNQQTTQGVQIGASVATPVIGGIIAGHAASVAAATGAPALIAGLAPAIAIPIIGAALMGVTLLAVTLIRNSGCGQTCVVTSQWANEAAVLLQQNLDAYFALPSPRTKAQQGVALANFDAIWAALKAQCGQPATGDAGKRCISDRQEGACKWKDANGECWNWFLGYRAPLANDAAVSDSPIDSALSLLGGGSGDSSILPLLAIGGLVALAVAL